MTLEEFARAGAPVPKVHAFRLVGPGAAKARGRVPLPHGARADDAAAAWAVALDADHASELAKVAAAIPAVGEVDKGALVVVLPLLDAPSLTSRVLAAFGGKNRAVPRSLRSSALLARGYVRLGAGVDPDTRLDLAWGYAPTD